MARPVLVLLAGQVVAAGVAFAINIMSAAVLEPSARGQLALLLQITYLLSVASLLGIERPYIANRHAQFSMAVTELTFLFRPGLWSLLVPVGVGIGFLISGNVPLACAMALIALFLVGNVHVQAIRVAYLASGAVKNFLITALATQMVLLLVGATLLWLRVEDPNIWFMAYGATSLVAVVIVRSNVDRSGGTTVDRDLNLRGIRSQGLRMLPASFGNTAMLRSERLLLPLLASNAQLGFYVVVATVMEMATWPIQQWVDSSLRKWNAEAAATLPHGLRLMARAAALVVGLSTVFGLLAYYTIVLLLPEVYAQSLALILPLGVASVFYAMTRVQQGLLIARGQAARVSLVEVVGMIASVTMYVILIPEFGALGAALGSAVGYFVCLICGVIVLASQKRRAPGTDSRRSLAVRSFRIRR